MAKRIAALKKFTTKSKRSSKVSQRNQENSQLTRFKERLGFFYRLKIPHYTKALPNESEMQVKKTSMREAYAEFLQFEDQLKQKRLKKEGRMETYKPFSLDSDVNERVKASFLNFIANQLSATFEQMRAMTKDQAMDHQPFQQAKAIRDDVASHILEGSGSLNSQSNSSYFEQISIQNGIFTWKEFQEFQEFQSRKSSKKEQSNSLNKLKCQSKKKKIIIKKYKQTKKNCYSKQNRKIMNKQNSQLTRFKERLGFFYRLNIPHYTKALPNESEMQVKKTSMREAYAEFLQFEDQLKQKRLKKEGRMETYKPFSLDSDVNERVKASFLNFIANQLSATFEQMRAMTKDQAMDHQPFQQAQQIKKQLVNQIINSGTRQELPKQKQDGLTRQNNRTSKGRLSKFRNIFILMFICLLNCGQYISNDSSEISIPIQENSIVQKRYCLQQSPKNQLSQRSKNIRNIRSQWEMGLSPEQQSLLFNTKQGNIYENQLILLFAMLVLISLIAFCFVCIWRICSERQRKSPNTGSIDPVDFEIEPIAQ